MITPNLPTEYCRNCFAKGEEHLIACDRPRPLGPWWSAVVTIGIMCPITISLLLIWILWPYVR